MTFSNLPFNLSPKLAYAFITRLIAFAALHWGVDVDPVLSALIAEAVANIVGYRASPGDVVEKVGPASDSLLSLDVEDRIHEPAKPRK